METYYLAVTYDVCVHNDLYEDMNQYPLDSTKEMEKQVAEIAKQDIAPVVKVFIANSADLKGDVTLYKEFYFKEFECNCTEYVE
ncbi:hypothetical protein [Ornithinibacillus hominis]|uniref:Uncharacterized protein n=1 Tax=Ornithinibacillus hominis TaxID=2763055 RepID=A0A923L7T6_9BACI|nr:hypothetical protein [Ornithinibacillus hominis]MBC5638086.1 hypothetical protein [Ornithinibacillus hominis]